MVMNRTGGTMPAQLLDQHRKWRDDLIVQLRLKDVPGDRIGDILLEVESHIRETGETPEEAFGPAKAYAETYVRANPPRREQASSIPQLILIGASSFAGTYLLSDGALSLGRGVDAILGLSAWVTLLIGLALLVITLARLPVDLIRHPVTGASLFREFRHAKSITMAIILVIGVVLYLIGRLLA